MPFVGPFRFWKYSQIHQNTSKLDNAKQWFVIDWQFKKKLIICSVVPCLNRVRPIVQWLNSACLIVRQCIIKLSDGWSVCVQLSNGRKVDVQLSNNLTVHNQLSDGWTAHIQLSNSWTVYVKLSDDFTVYVQLSNDWTLDAQLSVGWRLQTQLSDGWTVYFQLFTNRKFIFAYSVS